MLNKARSTAVEVAKSGRRDTCVSRPTRNYDELKGERRGVGQHCREKGDMYMASTTNWQLPPNRERYAPLSLQEKADMFKAFEVLVSSWLEMIREPETL